MHGDWRLWQPLLIKLALVVNNKFIKKDPIVSEFNEHEHFLRIVVEAFAEYVVEIAQTGQEYHNCANFVRRAERNLTFAYICYISCFFSDSNTSKCAKQSEKTTPSSLILSGARTYHSLELR